MPRSGGEPGKLGNRYEGVWTVDSVLDVLDESAVSITVEPFDATEAQGIEFTKVLSNGCTEYHSAKRQKTGNIWSLADLSTSRTGRSILQDLVEKLRGNPRGAVVFVSSTTPNEMNELSERAHRSQSATAFGKQLEATPDLKRKFEDRILPLFRGNFAEAYDGLARWRFAGGPEGELIRRVEQRIRKSIYRPDGADFDPLTVRLLLSELLYDWFGQPLQRESVADWLSKYGFAEKGDLPDPRFADCVERRVNSYLRHVEGELVDPPIIRTEARKAFEILRNGDRRRLVILGPAGLGKSCTVAQILRLLKEANVPCLPVRLDVQAQALTSRQLGTALDLPESPAVVLADVARGGRSALVIDQLDSVSFASGRNQTLWDPFEELLLEADAYPNMRVVLVCRVFDADHDPRLRKILKDQSLTERIPLEQLTLEQVNYVLQARSVEASQISKHSLELLRLPLNLALYLQGDPTTRPYAFTEHDLLERYWEFKRRVFQDDTQWYSVIERLTDWLSENQSLSAPVHIMRELEQGADRLCGLHVLVREGNHYRFFHETFFDYCWARIFVGRGESLVDFLLKGEQHLFMRAQVRQVLTYQRQAAQDAYRRDLKELLTNPGIRYHLKKIALDWMRRLPDPDEQEWVLVDTHYPAEAIRRLGNDVLWRSVPWFDLLLKLGVWAEWINSSDVRVISRAVWLLSMKEIMSARSEEVATLFDPQIKGEKPWVPEYLGIFQFGEVHHSRKMFDFLLWAAGSGHFSKLPANHWIHFHDLPDCNGAYAAELLGILFDALDHPRDPQLENTFGVRHDFVTRTASANPAAFLSVILPRLSSSLNQSESEWHKSVLGSVAWERLVDDEMYDLQSALRSSVQKSLEVLAKEFPEQLDRLTKELEQSEHEVTVRLLLSAWSENGNRYADRIVTSLLRDVSRFELRFFAWGLGRKSVSQAAVRAAAPYCSQENYEALERAILFFTPEAEKKHPERRGHTELRLLGCLPMKRMSLRARRRMEELKRKFVDMSGLFPRIHSGFVPSPIPRESVQLMTDKNWLSAMEHYKTDRAETFEGYTGGGIFQLSSELRRVAQVHKQRFADLALRMDATIPAAYFEAILSGITNERNEAGRDEDVPASALEPAETSSIVSVIKVMHARLDRDHGKSICWAISHIAERNPSDAVVDIVSYYAIHDADPDKDTWRERIGQSLSGDPHHYGINSTRGAAAEAIASLLFARRQLYDGLKPAIYSLVADKSIAVRSCAVAVLVAMLNFDRSAAVTLFLKLIEGADELLGSAHMDQFLHHAIYDHYAQVRPVMLRMLTLPNERAREIAGRQITVAAFQSDLAKDDLEQALAGDAACRKGAAGVYSHNFGRASVADVCREYLPRFFDDPDKNVRAVAADCFRALPADRVRHEQDLMLRFIASAACPEENHDLISVLEESVEPLPQVVCRLPEKLIELHLKQQQADHIEKRMWTYHLPRLVTRLYAQSRDNEIKSRCLDVIDSMLELGFSEIDDELLKVERWTPA